MKNTEALAANIDDQFEDVLRQGGIDPVTFGEDSLLSGPETHQITPFGVSDVMTNFLGRTSIAESQTEPQLDKCLSSEKVYSNCGGVQEIDELKVVD
jgi:hypothetical protein